MAEQVSETVSNSLTVICEEEIITLGAEIYSSGSPLFPGIPGVPMSPLMPFSPRIPGGPCLPTLPGCPIIPCNPLLPTLPRLPLSPLGPALPGGPCGPAGQTFRRFPFLSQIFIRKVTMFFKSSIISVVSLTSTSWESLM